MNIKKLLIFILIILLTGCSAEYNIKISNNTIEENFISKIYLSEIPKPNPLYPNIPVDDQITPFIEGEQYPFYQNKDIKYNKDIVEEDEYRIVKYNYKFTKEEFAKSRVLNLCFEYSDYQYSDNYIFNLSGNFYCLYNNKLDINVVTNNKVISNNADKVEGNKYTWHIDRNNVQDVNINMEIERNSTIKKISNYTLPIVILFIVFVSIITITIIKIKEKKHNQI